MEDARLQFESGLSQFRAVAGSLAQTAPATSQLLLLAAARLETFGELFFKCAAEGTTPEQTHEMEHLVTEFGLITSWLAGGPTPPPSAADLVSQLIDNVRAGWPPEIALLYVDVQRQSRRSGKPPTAARQEGLAVRQKCFP